jgi:predicted ABC-type transport system involved in lysophospholipase L1 biosynthesis ATPase subunit
VTAVLDVAGVSKDYRGLRPLRIQELSVAGGDSVGLVGFDQITAEVFVNLVTGATLPDAGHVAIFGRPTSDITAADEWLRVVDRLGIVSERAVLLDALTPLQNLAMPFTLDVEPLRDSVRQQAEALAAEVALAPAVWDAPLAAASPDAQARVRFGRALALRPDLLLLEHASARLSADQKRPIGTLMKNVAAQRGAALVAVTADEVFARAVASRVLHWDQASGRLVARRGWFGRRRG